MTFNNVFRLSPHPAYGLFAACLQIVGIMVAGLPFQQLLLLLVCRDITHGYDWWPRTLRWTAADLGGIEYAACAGRDDVQGALAGWAVLLHLAAELPGVLVLVVAGALVDLAGRRAALMIGATSAVLSAAAHLAAHAFDIPIALLVAVAFVQAFLGGLSLTSLAVSSYIVATSDPLRRTHFFMLQDGAFALAMAIGPVLGGAVVSRFGFRPVFLLELVLACTLFFFLLFIFPDVPVAAAPSDASDATASAGASAFASQKPSLKRVFAESVVASYRTLKSIAKFRAALCLVAIVTLQGLAMSSYGIMFFMYPAKRFGWDSLKIGQFIFRSNVQKIMWLTFLVPAILRFVKARGWLSKTGAEIIMLRFGILMAVFSELWFGFASTESSFLIGTSFSAMAVFASPTIRSLLSSLVPPEFQGRLFSSIRLFDAVALMFATVVVNGIYSSTVNFFPQAIFFCTASVMSMAFLVAVFGVTSTGVAEMEMGADLGGSDTDTAAQLNTTDTEDTATAVIDFGTEYNALAQEEFENHIDTERELADDLAAETVPLLLG
ncbi:hypothetical protein HK100_006187 [Physocladia obscura]|uniref:MFS transporter n=1 Tax=Physocladia obscura TaxID=109957 RepID=A0AAD5SQS9_9FUNG|nr:hypothetical protein HK100_006187 [Physocladia obscura]